MTAFVLRRVAAGIAILFVASFLTYLLVAESGDPLATLKANPHTTQATIEAAKARLGLDHSLLDRYWLWLSHFVQGDFGKSTQGRQVDRGKMKAHSASRVPNPCRPPSTPCCRSPASCC